MQEIDEIDDSDLPMNDDFLFGDEQDAYFESADDDELPILDSTSNVNESQMKDKKWKGHKIRSLIGKPACKFCDIVFKSRELRNAHDCPYLRCDPSNFICRTCNKELSRQTFSNHMHETSDCQYCQKKFMNPRNLRIHIEKRHKDEQFVPQEKKNFTEYIQWKEEQEKDQPNFTPKKSKAKYKRKSVKLECGKFL